MTYTKQQLGQMPNWELSLILCELLNYKVQFIHAYHEDEFPTINVFGETAGEWFAIDFGRWDCIMSLAEEYDIGVRPAANQAWKYMDDYIIEFDCKPQRGVVCCLIMFLQEENK